MRRFSFLISKYVFQAIIPYFVFTWLLLSVILFVQQAGRYSDLLFSVAIPDELVWKLTIALIPNVIAFTCPIAALVGVIIGLSRMQGDSEMVALRAAGVGNLQISVPIILLGVLLSLFALFVNLRGVPFAAQIVRQVGLQAALYKLDSPVEPGVFNSEIKGFTVYVRNGNTEKKTWENVFIYQGDGERKQTRLITAKEGRIDSKGDDSEIVLKDANVTTFEEDREDKIASEVVRDLRLQVETKRGEIVDRLSKTKEEPEEMGLKELAAHIQTLEGRDRTDAHILWQRRILLSVTPLLFSLLGASLVVKFNRGGRGFGMLLALVSLVVYYLLALLGEQLARTGSISVIMSGVIPFGSCIAVIAWLLVSQRLFITRSLSLGNLLRSERESDLKTSRVSRSNRYIDMTTGILDLDLVWNLLKNYLLTFGFLTAIYMIFTAFERWKFVGTIDNGFTLLISYLFFLIPFIYIQIAPSALMIATLATYIIKSRQNEIVTWTAAGQSIYRLLLPCFVLMIVVGFVNLGIQEYVLTGANRTQDSLLEQIKTRNKVLDKKGQYWIAENDSIYSFEKDFASDNEDSLIQNLQVFEFLPSDSRIKSLTIADKARWDNSTIVFLSPVKRFAWQNGKVSPIQGETEISAPTNPFIETITKPSHLDIRETYKRVHNSYSDSDQRTYAISLQKKYSTPFLPFIITLFTAPFALSLSRKGNVMTLAYAIAIWLLFMGITNTFQQFGTSGFLSPGLAVWGPLGIFTILGVYLLTKIRT